MTWNRCTRRRSRRSTRTPSPAGWPTPSPGRICNYFDLGGGGYTVDGACSSSLISIATAAKALVDGDLDVCLAGGVDLSIDPFEVIGFAKTGALATGEMKIYDKDSNGFWPGEGSGVVVLMREEDAIARGLRIYASITGWGMSSDGKGGITRPGGRRPPARDQPRLRPGRLRRGDRRPTSRGTAPAPRSATPPSWRRSGPPGATPTRTARPAAISSIKGNIGHTKAAAGVGGLIKAALSVYHQVIPPATGHYEPHPKLTGDAPALYVPSRAGAVAGRTSRSGPACRRWASAASTRTSRSSRRPAPTGPHAAATGDGDADQRPAGRRAAAVGRGRPRRAARAGRRARRARGSEAVVRRDRRPGRDAGRPSCPAGRCGPRS